MAPHEAAAGSAAAFAFLATRSSATLGRIRLIRVRRRRARPHTIPPLHASGSPRHTRHGRGAGVVAAAAPRVRKPQRGQAAALATQRCHPRPPRRLKPVRGDATELGARGEVRRLRDWSGTWRARSRTACAPPRKPTPAASTPPPHCSCTRRPRRWRVVACCSPFYGVVAPRRAPPLLQPLSRRGIQMAASEHAAASSSQPVAAVACGCSPQPALSPPPPPPSPSLPSAMAPAPRPSPLSPPPPSSQPVAAFAAAASSSQPDAAVAAASSSQPVAVGADAKCVDVFSHALTAQSGYRYPAEGTSRVKTMGNFPKFRQRFSTGIYTPNSQTLNPSLRAALAPRRRRWTRACMLSTARGGQHRNQGRCPRNAVSHFSPAALFGIPSDVFVAFGCRLRTRAV